MKNKIIIPILLIALLFSVNGCKNSKADEAQKNIKDAIIAEDYHKASDYCYTAIKEGYATDEIFSIDKVLTAYLDAQTAIENNDYELALTILNKISYSDGFPSLMNNIKKLKNIASNNSKKPAEEITDSPAPEPPNKPTEEKTGKNPTDQPEEKKLLSEEECRKIAIGDNNSTDMDISVEDMGSYYRYSITSYISSPTPDGGVEIIEDGYNCSVDKVTGEVFDQAG